MRYEKREEHTWSRVQWRKENIGRNKMKDAKEETRREGMKNEKERRGGAKTQQHQSWGYVSSQNPCLLWTSRNDSDYSTLHHDTHARARYRWCLVAQFEGVSFPDPLNNITHSWAEVNLRESTKVGHIIVLKVRVKINDFSSGDLCEHERENICFISTLWL